MKLQLEVGEELMRAKIREALDDPLLSIPAKQVFADLRAFHEEQIKGAKRGAYPRRLD